MGNWPFKAGNISFEELIAWCVRDNIRHLSQYQGQTKETIFQLLLGTQQQEKRGKINVKRAKVAFYLERGRMIRFIRLSSPSVGNSG